jgi:hypothetical protein
VWVILVGDLILLVVPLGEAYEKMDHSVGGLLASRRAPRHPSFPGTPHSVPTPCNLSGLSPVLIHAFGMYFTSRTENAL